jgi:phosphoglycolate phosphatase-like HAD superfamily hydrolase
MTIYQVNGSPWNEDEDLPWQYTEHNLIAWVDEVFLENYKDDTRPFPTIEEALEVLRGNGYEVEKVKG